MERLKVELGERSYPIEIAAGLLQHAEVLTQTIKGKRVMIVTNTVVAPLYLERIIQLLSGFQVEHLILPGHQFMRNYAHLGVNLARRHAVRSSKGGVELNLLLESGDAHLEEFVHIAADDAQELQAFQQWVALIFRLRQHAPVESEQAQLTVEVILGGIQFDRYHQIIGLKAVTFLLRRPGIVPFY